MQILQTAEATKYYPDDGLSILYLAQGGFRDFHVNIIFQEHNK